MTSITGYIAFWRGIVCVLPLTPIRGEWWGTTYNQQEVFTYLSGGRPVQFSVIHYAVGTEYD